MRNFVQPGDVLTLTAPSGGVVGGLGYKIGQFFVVAAADAVETAEFEGQLTGVFDLVKNAGQAWTEGQLLYWDDGALEVQTLSVGFLCIGAAARAADSAAVVGRVRLNGIARADGA